MESDDWGDAEGASVADLEAMWAGRPVKDSFESTGTERVERLAQFLGVRPELLMSVQRIPLDTANRTVCWTTR